MSKKRGKNKSQECQCPKCQNKLEKSVGGLGDNPFGINSSQLMGMLGNVDMGQIGNILSSMNNDGFDLNNLNLGSIQNMMSGINGMNGGQNNQELSSVKKMMSGIGGKDTQGLSSIEDMMTNMKNEDSRNINYSNNGSNNSGHNKKIEKILI